MPWSGGPETLPMALFRVFLQPPSRRTHTGATHHVHENHLQQLWQAHVDGMWEAHRQRTLRKEVKDGIEKTCKGRPESMAMNGKR
eukprot:scaffold524_cov357-Pavlova_lutheri.AAC.33